METLDQLARWLAQQRESALRDLAIFAEAGDQERASETQGEAAAFFAAHEKVMLMVQTEAAQEAAPSVESTLPTEEVMALFMTNPILTVDTCVQSGLDRGDSREALQWLAADGRLAMSVENGVELWALA